MCNTCNCNSNCNCKNCIYTRKHGGHMVCTAVCVGHQKITWEEAKDIKDKLNKEMLYPAIGTGSNISASLGRSLHQDVNTKEHWTNLSVIGAVMNGVIVGVVAIILIHGLPILLNR